MMHSIRDTRNAQEISPKVQTWKGITASDSVGRQKCVALAVMSIRTRFFDPFDIDGVGTRNENNLSCSPRNASQSWASSTTFNQGLVGEINIEMGTSQPQLKNIISSA
jgi:hypothetical protein